MHKTHSRNTIENININIRTSLKAQLKITISKTNCDYDEKSFFNFLPICYC